MKRKNLIRNILFAKRLTPFKSAVETFIFTAIVVIFNFGRSMIIAYYFGASKTTDIFYAANTLIQTPTRVLSDALTALIIPEYQKQKQKDFFIRSYLVSIVLIFTLLSFILFFFGKLFAGVIYMGFDKNKVYQISIAMKIMVPIVLLTPCIRLFDSVFRAEKYLIYGNLGKLSNSIASFIFIIILLTLSYRGLAISLIPGLLCYFGILFVFYIKRYNLLSGKVNLKYALLKMRKAIPLIIGGTSGLIFLFSDKFFSSFLEEGNLTLVSMSVLLINVLKTLFVVTMIGVYYPFISESLNKKDETSYSKYIQQIRKMVFGGFGLLLAILLGISFPALRLLYGHGKFSHQSVEIFASLVNVYSYGIINAALANTFLFVYYSLGKTKLPLITSFICTNIGSILLQYFFMKKFGVLGLPVGIAVASYINLLADFVVIKKVIKRDTFKISDIAFSGVLCGLTILFGFLKWRYYFLFLPFIYYVIVSRIFYRFSFPVLLRVFKNKKIQ